MAPLGGVHDPEVTEGSLAGPPSRSRSRFFSSPRRRRFTTENTEGTESRARLRASFRNRCAGVIEDHGREKRERRAGRVWVFHPPRAPVPPLRTPDRTRASARYRHRSCPSNRLLPPLLPSSPLLLSVSSVPSVVSSLLLLPLVGLHRGRNRRKKTGRGRGSGRADGSASIARSARLSRRLHKTPSRFRQRFDTLPVGGGDGPILDTHKPLPNKGLRSERGFPELALLLLKPWARSPIAAPVERSMGTRK